MLRRTEEDRTSSERKLHPDNKLPLRLRSTPGDLSALEYKAYPLAMHTSFAAAAKQCQEEAVTSSDATHPGNSVGYSPNYWAMRKGVRSPANCLELSAESVLTVIRVNDFLAP
jgi:hypothetical protein